MSPPEIAAVRWELEQAHQRADAEFAAIRRLLAKLEAEWRERQREREQQREAQR